MNEFIPIYKPFLADYKKSAIDAINSEWVSNHGKYISLSENKLNDILDTKYCILMCNGTASTHCLYIALNYKYPNISKIYIPNRVFVAPWNTGMFSFPKKIFEVMKTDPATLNIDVSEEYIMSLDKDSAIVIVHNYGNIVNVPRLKRMRPDMIFLEDNCEGLFGKYEGRYSGTASLCSSCSFYGNKTVTTGEGGAFFTNDDQIYNYIKSFYSHGMTEQRYIHDVLAVNYRMTNVQAALLYDQLCDLDRILSLKKQIIDRYTKELDHLDVLESEKDTESSNWMFVAITDRSYQLFEKFMKGRNIDVRPLFFDIHEHPHLKDVKRPDDELIINGFILPSYPELSYDQQSYIIDMIKKFHDII